MRVVTELTRDDTVAQQETTDLLRCPTVTRTTSLIVPARKALSRFRSRSGHCGKGKAQARCC
ncbi:hypothetical protein OHA11_09175 [Streptomyces sp. NBC_00878]|nr:hypothetical protein [Streptomyces sp. NBC_00878]MCX4904501.1 hypothetical protein [Streptomyces sp. NBC_00878]